jgi:hypothetical protein
MLQFVVPNRGHACQKGIVQTFSSPVARAGMTSALGPIGRFVGKKWCCKYGSDHAHASGFELRA